MLYLDHILYTYLFLHCPATGLHYGVEALSSIISASQGFLVKVLITPELHGIF